MKKIAFTIVLNGMPFIKKQAEIIPQIFDVWYIIEGATLPIYDTAWCKNIDNKFYTINKLSIDGTTEFLNSIKSSKIKIIRKNDFWNGKLEMCNSFINEVENSILMEFDVDEIWDKNVLIDVLDYSEKNDHFQGMMFKCNYFVGPNLLLKGENCYGDMPYEWCRLWKIKNKTHWLSHEPPRLYGINNFLSKDFTKSKEWIFNHYAYMFQSQVEFKENFYGYNNAVSAWKKLQQIKNEEVFLKDFLPWVVDNTIVKRV